jgi:hypothetical protein
MNDHEVLRKALRAAYLRGYREARNELLAALKNHPLRVELLAIFAKEKYGRKP